jgi:hypothetical protein
MTKFPAVDIRGEKRKAYAVVCTDHHGIIYLTNEEYNYQMNRPNRTWVCPICHNDAYWEDDNMQEFMDAEEEGHQ